MFCRYYPPIGLLFIVFYLVVSHGGRSNAQTDDGLRTINATDLGTCVKIIGRLGKPMSEAVAIKGYWLFDRGTKASPYVFRVTTVAGKQLEKPVDFNQGVITLDSVRVSDDDSVLGETWTCVAIELGQFRNAKEKHWDLFYGKEAKRGSWLIYGDGPFVSELLLAKRSLEREKGERLPSMR